MTSVDSKPYRRRHDAPCAPIMRQTPGSSDAKPPEYELIRVLRCAASKAASPLTVSARITLRPRSAPTFAVKHRIGHGFAFSVAAKNAAGEGIASPALATFRRILRISSAAPAMVQIKLPKNLEINTRTRAAHNQGIADLIAGREIKPPRYGKLAAARPTAAAVPKVMEDVGSPRPTTRNRQRAGQAIASRRCYTAAHSAAHPDG